MWFSLTPGRMERPRSAVSQRVFDGFGKQPWVRGSFPAGPVGPLNAGGHRASPGGSACTLAPRRLTVAAEASAEQAAPGLEALLHETPS